ncbi:MAG TPA: DUF2844 domain-containing protein [Bryobacteraceae bacterium]|nr:DUF2844 domain-containing protein [Bryobacteraceae bacterium]
MQRALALLAALAAAAIPGWAVLGGSAESVVTDQLKFQAKRAVVENQQYTVHELSRDDGTLIREYVTPAGKVFGVSWSGPTIPDLSQLLGPYSAEFQNSVHAKGGRRRTAGVHTSDLVVESSGHMRAFYGRAYLNSMLPSGVGQEMVK